MNRTMKKALTGLVFMLVLAVGLGTAFANTGVPGTSGVQKTPYLFYPGVNTEMEVLWQDYDAETTNVVSWGTDTTYSTGSATGARVYHRQQRASARVYYDRPGSLTRCTTTR